jgi:hypothetical protein
MAANDGRMAPTAIIDRGDTGEKFGVGSAMFESCNRLIEDVE